MPLVAGMDELEWLQRWYESRCDGEWEHERGVAIESCDNPGWWVRIDIDKEPARPGGDVVLETLGDPPSEKNGNVGSKRWMLCQVRGDKFDGAGDATQLSNIIRCFRQKVAGPVP
jgi:immunity protein 53 of polymorphic toxin system